MKKMRYLSQKQKFEFTWSPLSSCGHFSTLHVRQQLLYFAEIWKLWDTLKMHFQALLSQHLPTCLESLTWLLFQEL